MADASAGARANRLPRSSVALLVTPPLVLLLAFYVWPVASLAAEAITGDALRAVWHDPVFVRVAWFSTWQALVSTVATLAVAALPTWLLARHDFRGRRAVSALITVPFVLPTVVVGAAFLALLPTWMHGTVGAIVLAHVFFNVAVVVRIVGGVWENVPDDLVDAARVLGAPPARAAREVTLALLAPSIAAAAGVVFLFTFTSFGVVRLLGGPAHPTLEVEIWQRATRFGEVGVAAVLSLAQLVALGAVVGWLAWYQRRRQVVFALHPVVHGGRRRARRRGGRPLVIALTSAGVIIAVCVPLAALVERSLRTGVDGSHSWEAWRAVLTTRAPPGPRSAAARVDALGSLTTSLRVALVATILSTVVGTAASLAIVALGRAGRVLDVGVMLPLGTSAITIGFGLLLAFDTAPFDWRASPWLIPLGHALVATPFVVRTVLAVLRAIDPQLRAAAATLGASPVRTWCQIDVRLARRPAAIGAGFALAISLGEFGATTLLTRQGRTTLPIAIEQLLSRPGALLHAEGYVLATILALSTFVVLSAVEALRRPGGGRARR